MVIFHALYVSQNPQEACLFACLSQVIPVGINACRHLFSEHFSFLALFLSFTHIDRLNRLFHSLVLQQAASVVVNFASVVRKSLANRQRISCLGGSVSADSLRKDTERSLSLDSETEPTIEGPSALMWPFQQRQLRCLTIMKCYLRESNMLLCQPNV